MDSAKEKDGTQVQNNNFDTINRELRLSLLFNNHNMAWNFVRKYEQVSTYVSGLIPL